MRFPPLTRSARKIINSDLQNKEKSRERPGVTAARAKREKRFFILTYHNRKKCGNGMGLPPLAQIARTIFNFDIMNHQNMKNFDNNRQHDAAEFLNSMLEHMLYNEIEVMRHLFGQTQERLFCTNMECNTADHSPYNMVNIIAIPIVGTTLHMA